MESCTVQDHERLQKIGMMNRDVTLYEQLVGRRIESAVSRGNTIRIKTSGRLNLILAPEYGGRILYNETRRDSSVKFHLKLGFSNGSLLTVRLTGMGVIQVAADSELADSYVYRRDFNREVLSPVDEEFTQEQFSRRLVETRRPLKAALVGKDAVVVGLSNSAFQDIAFRAKLHPKRKTSELEDLEMKALYDTVKALIEERIRLGGKDQFLDLNGRKGKYVPLMGPNMRGKGCPRCGTPVGKMSLGGGEVYFCPECQT